MKSAQTNTLLAGRVKKFRPAADPLPWGTGRQNLIREMVTTFTYKLRLVRIDTRNVELSW